MDVKFDLKILGNRKPSMSEILNMLLDMKEQDEKYQEQKKHEAEHGKSTGISIWFESEASFVRI